MGDEGRDFDRFIIENTEISNTPLVPEIRLRLLKPDSDLWRAFDSDSNSSYNERPYWAFAWSGGQALARHVLETPEVEHPGFTEVRVSRIVPFVS